MEKRIIKTKGMLALEPGIIMLIFIFVMILINNGIVNLVQEEWLSAAESAALGGAGTLNEEEGNANASQDAIDETIRLALLHSWMGGAIQAGQVNVTLGQWSSCIFTPSATTPNAVRVDISPPVDGSGNTTGIMAFFGTIDLPFFQLLGSQTTAVAAYYDRAVVLVEYQGNVCLN